MTFKHFDTAVATNEFWTLPMENIQRNLGRNLEKDTQNKEGVSLVMGCPFDEELLLKIADIKKLFQQELVSRGASIDIAWREKPDAFHFTVYGLVLPKEFSSTRWPLSAEYIENLRNIFHTYKGLELYLQGLGILGMGAVSLRVSDSSELEKMRDEIIALPETSKEQFGSRTKKIVLGRVRSISDEISRQSLREVIDSLKDFQVGILRPQALKIVHYGNTFLERVIDEIEL